MPLRLGALHDALLHPGDADLAQKAAEEVAAYQQDIHGIRVDLSDIRGHLRLHDWMLGFLIALQIGFGLGNLWLTLTLLSRVPR